MGLPTGTVTFLFTDIEGSTRLLDRLGANYSPLLQRHHEIVRGAIARHDGVEVSVAGDGFFAAFSRASAAVTACLEMQLAFTEQTWPTGAEVLVRMGLHTGEADIVDGHYLGMAVHEAARISDAGHGGQVLLSSRTFALAGPAFTPELSAEELGAHRLKDISEPVSLFQLVHPGLPRRFRSIRVSSVADPAPLPLERTPLVARVELVAEVLGRLREGARLVTLLGPGGIGKTRVSIAVARAIAEEGELAWFASLAPVDVAAVPTAVARAVGADLQGDVGVEDAVVRSLRSRKGLLVVDNFEHVMGAAPFVGRLLEQLPDLAIIVTSREALRLSAEVQLAVQPLSLPLDPADEEVDSYDAVRLFLDRAAAVAPGFAPTRESLEAIARICRRLDGIPLAIELAAGRLGTISARDLLGQLDLLDLEGATDLPDRHRTLRNTVRWSYDLLEPDEARIMRRTSVFLGGWTTGTATSVCGDAPYDEGISRVLGELVQQSLFRLHEADDGSTRYDMLETVRAFALDELVTSGEYAEVAKAHALHFVELVEQSVPALATSEAPAWCARLHLERANLRAAFDHLCATGDRASALRMVRASIPRWRIQGELAVAAIWIDEVLQVGEPLGSADEAIVLAWRAEAARRRGDSESAERNATDALALARSLDDPNALHDALLAISRCKTFAYKDREESEAVVSEAEARARDRSDTPGLIDVLVAKSRSIHMLPKDKLRREVLDEAAALARNIEDRWRLAQVASATSAIGLFGDAGAQARTALLFRELGDEESELETLEQLIQGLRTPPSMSRAHVTRLAELAERTGNTRALVRARLKQARIALGDCRLEEYHARVGAAVEAAIADPTFRTADVGGLPAGWLQDAASDATMRAGQWRFAWRTNSNPVTRLRRSATDFSNGAAVGRTLKLGALLADVVFGLTLLVAATTTAVAGLRWSWPLGAMCGAFALGQVSARRSDLDTRFTGVGPGLAVLIGPFDWGAALIGRVVLVTGGRALLSTHHRAARLLAAGLALVGGGLLLAGHAGPGPVPVALVLIHQVSRLRDRALASTFVQGGAVVVAQGLCMLVALSIEGSTAEAVGEMWLVALTVLGAVAWSVGIAIYGGPFRPAGWAVGLVAITAILAAEDPRLTQAWGVLALAVIGAVALSGVFLKTGEPVSLRSAPAPAADLRARRRASEERAATFAEESASVRDST